MPFHFTTEVETKSLPLTFIVNEGSPAVELFGVMELRIGKGLALTPSATFFYKSSKIKIIKRLNPG